MSQRSLPQRERLPHGYLPWIDPDAVFSLTVCTDPRGVNQLCHPSVAARVRESLEFRAQRADWQLLACVLMPDHVHLLVRLARPDALEALVSAWKRHLARSSGIRWQRDFFDRRLRQGEHYAAKLEYLRQNPVRAELVARPEDWPYLWTW